MTASIPETLGRNRFALISWLVTAMIVAGLLGVTLWWTRSAATAPALAPQPTADPQEHPPSVALSAPEISLAPDAIERLIQLKTTIPQRQRYEAVKYRVSRGDSVFAIADDFGLEPETVYWANYEVFGGSPSNIKPGQELVIPPTDGVYYEWEEGDTIETIAGEFDVEPDAILYWPGNDFDLTNPTVPPGAFVMIPGAEKNDQPLFIQTVTRESTSGGTACGGGYQSQGFFVWPTAARYLSGYDFGQNGHNGIDIFALEGTPVYAADNGVVTMAQGGWNYGYGNVVQIDHGNGFVTIYAHLSSYMVSECQSVAAGAPIGAAGNTGNSLGSHLHFEIRFGGNPENPWNYLP